MSLSPAHGKLRQKKSSPQLKASQSYTVRRHLKDRNKQKKEKNKREKNETSITKTLNTDMKSWEPL